MISESGQLLVQIVAGGNNVLSAQTVTITKTTTGDATSINLFTRKDFIQSATGAVFDKMTKFDGYDEGEFSTSHEQLFGTPSTQGEYSIYVMCEDKAGHQTGMETLSYDVNLEAELAITSETPPYFQTTDAYLKLSTNKKTLCYYTDDVQDPAQNIFGYASATKMEHETPIFTLPIGVYDYYITCSRLPGSQPESKTKWISFAVDTTPPDMISINVSDQRSSQPGYTYYTDRLFVNAYAEDADIADGITIAKYEFVVYGFGNTTGELVAVSNQTSTEGEATLKGLKLEDGESYYIIARAQNIAGWWSTTLQSTNIIVDTSLRPIECENNKKDSGESDIDCGGSCTGCSAGQVCNQNADCLSGICSIDAQTGIGYCAASQPGTECFDTVLSGDETDVDCGGSCAEKCIAGKICAFGTDCTSGVCDNGICQEDPCFNGVWDEGEASEDCGGTCALGCAEGQYCNENSDCASHNCLDNVCLAMNLDDLDNDGIPNEEDDDIDGDGIFNWEDPDDDNDGLCDTETSPLNKDEAGAALCEGNDNDDDGDGILDPDDMDTNDDLDNDGVINELDDDMDGDGIENIADMDNDNDGVLDVDDLDDDNDGITDFEEDNDADGIPNKWEDDNLLNKQDSTDAPLDNDNDGLSNLEEYKWGTDPNNPDTDGDGYNDKKEIDKGYDPLDPESHPKGFVPLVLSLLGITAVLGVGGYLGYTYFEPITGMTLEEAGQKIQSMFTGKKPPMQPTAPPTRVMPPRAQPPREMARQAARRMPVSKVEPEYVDIRELGKPKQSKVFEKLEEVTKPKPKLSESFDKLSMLSTSDVEKTGIASRLSKTLGHPVTKDTLPELRKIAEKETIKQPELTKTFEKLSKLGEVTTTHQKNLFKKLVESGKVSHADAAAALDKLAAKKVFTPRSKEELMKAIKKIAGK